MVDRLLTTQQAAELLNVPAGTLRWWRHNGTGPKSFRLGPRKVMYRHEDVEQWIAAAVAAEDSGRVA